MSTRAADSETHPALGKFVREYRTVRGHLWFMIALWLAFFAGITAMIAKLVISPAGDRTTAWLLALFLACFLPILLAAIRHDWVRGRRRYRLHEKGLEYVTGGHSTPIAWDQVAEIYEAVSSTKMYGITVASPKREVEIVAEDGTFCRLDEVVQDLQSLAPAVADGVNESLRQRAERSLRSKKSVPLGPWTVSADGIVIDEPRPRPYPNNVTDWWEPTLYKKVIRPGNYSWDDVADLRIAKATNGNVTFNRFEILGPGRGRSARLYAYPVPRVANFTVLCEVLAAVGHAPRFAT